MAKKKPEQEDGGAPETKPAADVKAPKVKLVDVIKTVRTKKMVQVMDADKKIHMVPEVTGEKKVKMRVEASKVEDLLKKDPRFSKA